MRAKFWSLIFILALISPAVSRAQSYPGEVDIFMGANVQYRDIYFNNRLIDFLVNLSPGVRWNMGHRWEAAMQVYIPVINQFGKDYGTVRLNNATLAKQFPIGNRWRFKITGGQFSANRYGLDLKTMWIANRWLAFTAEAGLTGFCYFAFSDSWEASTPERFTFLIGPEIWLGRWDTQFIIRGGRYTYGDYGINVEAMRHFKHTTVGLFAAYSDVYKENAGFKVTVMLPPYKQKRKKVNFRPASNFYIDYSNKSSPYNMRTYQTDPEQNVRQGWFDPNMNPWGPNTMTPDFERKEDKK